MIKLQNDNEIIMVDDSELDLRIAKRTLAQSNVKNAFVGLLSADLMLKYLEDVKTGKNNFPALILLDVNMPGMNGYEALKEVRSDSFFKEIPFIAMFSHSSHEEDIRKSLEYGANEYRVKPATIGEYLDFFNSLVGAISAANVCNIR